MKDEKNIRIIISTLVLFFFLVLFLPIGLISSEVKSNDLQLWSVVAIRKSLWKGLEVDISEQVRMQNNISKFESNLLEIGLKYDLTSSWRIKVAYRLKTKNEGNYNIYIVSTTLENELGDFAFIYRFRYDNEVYDEKDDEHYIRNRLTIEYEPKGLFFTPYVSGEIFYRFLYAKGDRFNRYRLRAGAEFKITKGHKLSLEYTYDSEFNMKKIDIKRVIGVNYSLDLDVIF